ncbi:hypothetical protein I3842_Q053200 [Carya illinoinensis]|uniref:Uncharacterized protein n=1 Tax=Carya illinoinensis TaxID=32201 RepID=A0A921ZYN0_CARIL|nr:hypothetical protein I3842_Q053200 [Carya illinoinensis]
MCFPRMMLLQVINMTWVVGVILILEMAASAAILAAAAAAPLAKPNCNDRCGNVEIPFPFGTSERCYLDHNYFVNCTYDSSGKTRRPMYGNLVVQNISLEGQFEFFGYPVYECFNELGTPDNRSSRLLVNFSSSFSYTHNLFVAIGCDTIAYLNGTKNNANFSTGCLSVCENINDVANGSCSGIGCCQLNIPKGLGESSLSVRSFSGHKGVWKSNPCSYAFIVKRDAFHFSPEYLIPNVSNMTFPVVFDWGIRYETCERAIAKSDILCGRNSACYDSSYGYRCRCNPGYGGNPYLLNGCQDINECQSGNNCTYPERCKNTMGNYTCSCRKGSRGDGRKDGTGCVAKKGRKDRKIGAGIGTASLVLVVGSAGVYWVIQTRYVIKLRLEFFKKNGGAQLSNQPVRIFSARELEKATNNYDKSRKLGQGGDGTVYRGVLTDNKVVAIKKSETVDEDQIKHFINEMIVLAQINHKNVVKLLGCCLETKVPLLVYEFIIDWTLSDHIHDKDKSSLLLWEKRLKIAIEAARALAYLHSKLIIHRNVKSANILLDENQTARVAEFGASRLVPLDHTRLEQGTFGYLDPEYLHSGQLTEKSDVYSFGVVLAELLTGEKVISFDRAENEKNLPTYFVSALKDDRALEIIECHIKNEDDVEELKEVSNIAKRCLSINGEDRPTMKDVEKELNELRMKKNHSNEEADLYREESENIGITLLTLLVGSFWVYWDLKKRNLIKLKEKFIQQNGGLMFQQLSNHKGLMEPIRIFDVKELEKATNDYDKIRILSQGGNGTIEQFVNEMIVLTQVNLRNVVKLLGCCLEIEVPLLKKHLKIATEGVGTLAYLHFETSIPIIHRDVITVNILLDDNHSTKVADFGASGIVPLDHTQLTTLVVEIEKNLAAYFVFSLKNDRPLEVVGDHIINEGNFEELKEVSYIAKSRVSVKGDDRPTMKVVAIEQVGLRIEEKHSHEKANLYREETECSLNAITSYLSLEAVIESALMTLVYSITSLIQDLNFEYITKGLSVVVWKLTLFLTPVKVLASVLVRVGYFIVGCVHVSN